LILTKIYFYIHFFYIHYPRGPASRGINHSVVVITSLLKLTTVARAPLTSITRQQPDGTRTGFIFMIHKVSDRRPGNKNYLILSPLVSHSDGIINRADIRNDNHKFKIFIWIRNRVQRYKMKKKTRRYTEYLIFIYSCRIIYMRRLWNTRTSFRVGRRNGHIDAAVPDFGAKYFSSNVINIGTPGRRSRKTFTHN